MSDQYEVVDGLSNGTIFNDLEQPLTQFSRPYYSLMLNISNSHSHSYYGR